MIDYTKLENRLRKQGITRSQLGKRLGISSRTIAKIAKGQKLSKNVLERIGAFLQCFPQEERECHRTSYMNNGSLLILADCHAPNTSGISKADRHI